jgi:hypothetical protein
LSDHGPNSDIIGSVKFFRLRLIRKSSSEIEEFLKEFDNSAKDIKTEIFRLSWYMRGAVSTEDLLHIYSFEDRQIIGEIAKENIELTKESRLPLM